MNKQVFYLGEGGRIENYELKSSALFWTLLLFKVFLCCSYNICFCFKWIIPFISILFSNLFPTFFKQLTHIFVSEIVCFPEHFFLNVLQWQNNIQLHLFHTQNTLWNYSPCCWVAEGNSKVGIFSCTNVIFADQKHLTRNCQVAVVWLYGVLLVQKKMEKYEEIRWNLMTKN